MTRRVTILKERYLNAKPTVSIERLLLATDAYKKYAGEAIPIFRAHVLAYVLENMEIVIHDDELIVGAISKFLRGALIFPEYKSNELLFSELDVISTRESDPMEMSVEDKAIAKECLQEYWEGKSVREGIGPFSEDAEYAMDHDIISVGFLFKSSAETVPNYKKLLEIGLNGYIDECDRRISELNAGVIEEYDKILFIRACKIVCEAVITFAQRYADKAEELAESEQNPQRKAELFTISRNCRNVPANPAGGFYEALQSIWMIHTVLHVETATTACSFGRFDQILYPYLQVDMDNGVLNEDEAQELMECFFLKCGEPTKLRDRWSSNAFAGFVMWPIIMVGGQDRDGNDATNKLSFLCLQAGENLQMSNPLIAMRVHTNTPNSLMKKACSMVQRGLANPGFFNDDVAMDIVSAKAGISLEEARNWNIVGCTQPHPGGGCADGHPDASYVNAAKCLELVLHNGVDPRTNRLIGLQTGDPSSFTCKEDILEAVKKQIVYFYKMSTDCVNIVQCYHMRKLPVMCASLMIDDCIQKGMSIQEGGARYNGTGLFSTGPANVTDSIVAIEDLVFKQKLLTMSEFIAILDRNFEGQEPLRQKILNECAKFGNDIPYVDAIYKDITNSVANEVQKFKDARDANYDFTLMSQTVNVMHGKAVGATPDGRKAGTPLADNASPMMGRDVEGPTATVNSVGSINQRAFRDGALFNLRFDPRGIKGEKGLETVEGVIRTYFKKGGQHVQINVVSDETLRDAQQNPENHRGLVVRVAGYMAYFTELAPDVQDALIQRTAHLQ